MDGPKMTFLKPPDQRVSGPSPRIPRSKKPSASVQRLQEVLNANFNARDRTDFIDALNEYHAQRDIREFLQVLYQLFDTPAKRQMIPILRKVIPQSDARVFDECMHRFLASVNNDSHSLPRPVQQQSRQTERLNPHPQQFRTLPLRPKNTPQRPKSAPTSPLVVRRFENPAVTSPSPVRIKNQPVKKISLKPQSAGHGWGFSIRGGSEHGIGIYVSYVDINSIAERQGLVPGDQIVSVNDISFEKIHHGDAAKIIKAAKRLDLIVRSVGKVPGSFETRQKFTWVDREGGSVSPPPDVDVGSHSDTAESRKSGFNLLNGSDERKVNVLVSDDASLGLSIRGGSEFGLGIYVTGVDENSVAENAGLKKGDQILDINGQSFVDVSHAEAVQILKHTKHLMMTIRDVGRVPHARMTYDHTRWLNSRSASPASSNRNSPMSGNGDNRDVFLRGAGSQLMLNSMANQHWVLIDDLSRHLLNTNERKTMKYYLTEYQRGHITTEALVIALFELLNTNAKMSLMKEVRNLIGPRDIDKFDMLILKKEVDALKAQETPTGLPSDRLSEKSFDSISSESQISTASFRDSLDGSGSDNCTPHLLNKGSHQPRHHKQVAKVSNDPLMIAIEQIADDCDTDSYYVTKNTRAQKYKTLLRQNHTPSTNGSTAPPHLTQDKTVTVEIHNTSLPSQVNEEIKPPSDDSGVEINSLQLDHQLNSKVTLSAERPVIINETIPEQSALPPGERSGISPPTSDELVNHHTPAQERRQSLDSFTSDNSSHSLDSQQQRLPKNGHFVLHNEKQIFSSSADKKQVTKLITVHKSKPILGVAIEGGAKTRQPLPRIIEIQPGGSAYDAADMRVGQVIVEVNGRSLEGMQHSEAARTIAEAFKSKNSTVMHMLVQDLVNK